MSKMGTFMLARRLADKKKQPIGTPALPTAAIVAMKIQTKRVVQVMSMPAFCIRYTTVMRMKAAHPFMLIVVHIGSTKRETFSLTPRFTSAQRMVTGRVPALDLEKNATVRAGSIPLKTRSGLMPRSSKRAGRITSI